ncbi:MAG: hypothetical protein Q9215_001860 [Flavoplaca cf. flavocitrina]
MAPPPQFFYRVQHRGSYTTYNPYNGFVSRGHYDVHPAELLNKRTVEAHLDWGDRSNQPSPFISVFDNYDMPTTERATMYSGEIAELLANIVDLSDPCSSNGSAHEQRNYAF